MNSPSRLVTLASLVLVAVCAARSPDAWAADAAGGPQAHKLIYVPPNRGAPRERVGGGTRGSADADLVLQLMAPEQAGVTTSDQPVLYWHTSKPATSTVEIAITTDDDIEPLLEQTLAPPLTAGLHALSLADAGVRLAPGATYKWSVAVVVDENQRSKDILSSAAVQFVPAASAPEKAMAATERAVALAGEGCWYDAFDVLSRQLQAHPEDATARGLRAELLSQVGLGDLSGAP